MIQQLNITCGRCEEELNVSFYDLLPLDRKNKNLLKTGDLFTVICPKCQNKIKLNYDCVMADEKNRYALALIVDDEDRDKVVSLFENHDETFRKRIVRSQQEALEKTFIFDSHLNDYAIEIMKAVHKIGLLKEFGSDTDIKIYYTKDPIVCFVILMNGETYSLPFEKDFYDQVVRDYLKEDESNFREVNYDWAVRILSQEVNA